MSDPEALGGRIPKNLPQEGIMFTRRVAQHPQHQLVVRRLRVYIWACCSSTVCLYAGSLPTMPIHFVLAVPACPGFWARTFPHSRQGPLAGLCSHYCCVWRVGFRAGHGREWHACSFSACLSPGCMTLAQSCARAMRLTSLRPVWTSPDVVTLDHFCLGAAAITICLGELLSFFRLCLCPILCRLSQKPGAKTTIWHAAEIPQTYRVC